MFLLGLTGCVGCVDDAFRCWEAEADAPLSDLLFRRLKNLSISFVLTPPVGLPTTFDRLGPF